MNIGKAMRRDNEAKKVGKHTTWEHEARVIDKKRSKKIKNLRKQKEEIVSSSGL